MTATGPDEDGRRLPGADRRPRSRTLTDAAKQCAQNLQAKGRWVGAPAAGTIDVMPNGKPGDHPITDIMAHHMEVFGPACDELIREICERGGEAALDRLRLSSLDPRFGGRPDLAALEAGLRAIRDRLSTS